MRTATARRLQIPRVMLGSRRMVPSNRRRIARRFRRRSLDRRQTARRAICPAGPGTPSRLLSRLHATLQIRATLRVERLQRVHPRSLRRKQSDLARHGSALGLGRQPLPLLRSSLTVRLTQQVGIPRPLLRQPQMLPLLLFSSLVRRGRVFLTGWRESSNDRIS